MNPKESTSMDVTTSTTSADQPNHSAAPPPPPPVIVQETDDEDDDYMNHLHLTTAVELLELDEETLNSGAEGYVFQ